jgi:hypothetical protein
VARRRSAVGLVLGTPVAGASFAAITYADEKTCSL